MAALVALLAALATATALLVRLVLAVVGGVRAIALLTKAMLATGAEALAKTAAALSLVLATLAANPPYPIWVISNGCQSAWRAALTFTSW